MVTKKQYEMAKEKYHKTGEKLKKTHGAGRTQAKKDYDMAKQDYKRKGRELKKTRKK